jgi:lipoprotein-releasing system permease protein
MSLSTYVASRFMRAGRENRFFSWISILTIAGVAIGVAAMIVVWSVINGFETELRKRFLAANAHIMAYKFPYGIKNYESWAETITTDFKEEVRGVSPFVHYETMARSKSLMHAVLIRGISPISREKVQSLRSIVDPKEALDILQKEIDDPELGANKKEPALIVGVGLLSLLDAKIGDIIELVEPEKESFGEMKPFRIIGTYDSGLKHYDNKLGIMSLTTAQRFFKLDDRVIGLEVGLFKPWDSQKIAGEMANSYTLSIREWQSFNRPLFEAMQNERVIILIITGLVALVAGLNILTTIFVAVSQRQRDISIFKALGANNRQVLSMFVNQSILIGVLGCSIGVALAYGISKLLERYQFVDLPDLYLLARLPINYDIRVYGIVCAVSILIAVTAGIIPAWVASRVNPVEGFRGNQGAA